MKNEAKCTIDNYKLKDMKIYLPPIKLELEPIKLFLTEEERKEQYLNSIACNVYVDDYLKGRSYYWGNIEQYFYYPISTDYGEQSYNPIYDWISITEKDAYKVLIKDEDNANNIIEKYNLKGGTSSLAISLLRLKETYLIPHSQNLSIILPLLNNIVEPISNLVKIELTKEIVDIILPNKVHKNLISFEFELLDLMWHPGKLSIKDIDNLYVYSSLEKEYTYITKKILDSLLYIEALYKYITDKLGLWHDITIDQQLNEDELANYWGKYTLASIDRDCDNWGITNCDTNNYSLKSLGIDFINNINDIHKIIFTESNKQKLLQLNLETSGELVKYIEDTKSQDIIKSFKEKLPDLFINEENTEDTECYNHEIEQMTAIEDFKFHSEWHEHQDIIGEI